MGTFIRLIIGLLSLCLLVNCDNFKSKELSQEKKLELAEKCSNAGKIYFKEFLANGLPEGYLYDEPEYHYNSKLNTCLIHIRYVNLGMDLSQQRNQVIDIFSNKTILYGWFERDVKDNTEKLENPPRRNIANYTSIEYFKQKDRLFSE